MGWVAGLSENKATQPQLSLTGAWATPKKKYFKTTANSHRLEFRRSSVSYFLCEGLRSGVDEQEHKTLSLRILITSDYLDVQLIEN